MISHHIHGISFSAINITKTIIKLLPTQIFSCWVGRYGNYFFLWKEDIKCKKCHGISYEFDSLNNKKKIFKTSIKIFG